MRIVLLLLFPLMLMLFLPEAAPAEYVSPLSAERRVPVFTTVEEVGKALGEMSPTKEESLLLERACYFGVKSAVGF